MNKTEKAEFQAYLRNCTDRQVRSVYDKEMDAGRTAYAQLAQAEAIRRGINLR